MTHHQSSKTGRSSKCRWSSLMLSFCLIWSSKVFSLSVIASCCVTFRYLGSNLTNCKHLMHDYSKWAYLQHGSTRRPRNLARDTWSKKQIVNALLMCLNHVPSNRETTQQIQLKNRCVQDMVLWCIICITASLKETRNTWKLEQTNTVPTRYQHGNYQRAPKPMVNVNFRSGASDGLPKGQRLRQLRSLTGVHFRTFCDNTRKLLLCHGGSFRKKKKPTWEIKGL